MKRVAVIILSAGILAGCNPFESSRAQQAREVRQQEKRARQERDEREELAKGLEEYARGRRTILKETIQRLERSSVDINKDIEILSQAITSEAAEESAADQDLPFETKLLHLLRNPQMNALAKKYLFVDFGLLQTEFTERVRKARAEEERYQKALSQSDRIYAEVLGESQKWVSMTKQQRESEIARLQQEIRTLESRRGSFHKSIQELTKKTLVGNLSKERERREQMFVLEEKCRDADADIWRKRGQVDFLRNPNVGSDVESQAATKKQTVYRQANSDRDRELATISRYYKPKTTVIQVVSETSEKSVAKLQDTMISKRQEIERDLDEARRKDTELQECLLAISVSSAADLKSLRSKIMK